MSLLRTRPIVLILPLLVVAGAAWLLLRGEGDPYDPVRELDAVEGVDDWLTGSGKSVALRPGSDAADVRDAIDALPDQRRGVLLRMGRATLEVDRETPRAAREAAPALVEAARLRARIDIDTRSGDGELEAWVELPDQAAPLGRAIVVAGIGPEQGVGVVEIKAERSPQRYDETPIALDLRSTSELASTAFAAAAALGGRGVAVTGRGGRLEVRVLAPGLEEAADAFRAASSALADVPAGRREDVTVYVDVRDRNRGPWSTLPLLSGTPGTSPDRAVALIERLEAADAEAFAATDLSYVRARFESRQGTLAAARAVRAAGADRVEIQWDLATRRDWMGTVAGARAGEATVDDRAATVVRLIEGIERARRAGIDGVRWVRADEDLPRLVVTRPTWIRGSGPLAEEDPDALRRLFRTVRGVGWPGTAAFQLSLGPDTCGPDTNRYASMTFVATSTGRAREVDGGSACDVEDQIATVREAWDATADR